MKKTSIPLDKDIVNILKAYKENGFQWDNIKARTVSDVILFFIKENLRLHSADHNFNSLIQDMLENPNDYEEVTSNFKGQYKKLRLEN